MGVYVRESSGADSVNLPNYVVRAWGSVVGGGGGGGSSGGESTSAASGGAGGGYISGAIRADGQTFAITVGRGGSPGTSSSDRLGDPGELSRITGNGNTLTGRGGGGGSGTPGASGGSSSFSGNITLISSGDGENTINISSDSNARAGYGGGAGRPGGNCGHPVLGANNDGIANCSTHGGSGGHGVNVRNGNNRLNGPNAVCGDREGKPGGNNGAGGGGAARGDRGGRGADGAAYFSWITFFVNDVEISSSTVNVASGQTFNLKWESPFTSGNENITYNNTGTSTVVRSVEKTDNFNNRSEIFFNVAPAVRISSLTASPNPQTSGNNGIPNYDSTISWTTAGGSATRTHTITSSGGYSASAGSGNSFTVTNLAQSTAGSNSPAPRTYTLTVTDGFSSSSQNITISAFNDNTPSSYSIPNRSNLEPNTSTQIISTAVSGIDMLTTVNAGPGTQVSSNSTSWSSSVLISDGQTFYVRATSPPFNTDPNGLTNSATFYVDVGTLRRFFTITTRAPIVQEIFNYPNYNTKVPFPDIDTIETAPDHPAKPFIETASIAMDDIELANPYGVEIKSSNQNIQMRKRISGSAGYTDWIDIRKI
jgi:hypothetical protein